MGYIIEELVTLLRKHSFLTNFPLDIVFLYNKFFSDGSSVKCAEMVSWLTTAFVLSREVPAVSEKVNFFIFMDLYEPQTPDIIPTPTRWHY